MGQGQLSLEPESDGPMAFSSCFQIARVIRPVMSVGRMCDGVSKVELNNKIASAKAPDGSTVCVFEGKPT